MGTPTSKELKKFIQKASHMKFNFEPCVGIGFEVLIPNAPSELINLLRRMLEIDPDKRISVEEAINHAFFYSLTELKKYQNRVISKIIESKEISLPILNKSKKV